MTFQKQTILVMLCLIMNACTKPPAETYTNPVGDGIQMGDPFVLQHDGRYYLYGTNAGDGFKAFTSTNLVEWDSLGYVFRKGPDTWGEARFWAPEIKYYQGKFYLAYSARKEGLPPGERSFRLCLAVADSPEGPFEDLYAPWFDIGWSNIDAHIFLDTDGTPYVYFARVGEEDESGQIAARVYGARLLPDMSGLDGDPVLCLRPDQLWEESTGGRDTRCNEGNYVLNIDGRYHMTYSGHHYASPAYAIGVASALTPLGPWTKNPANPIVGTVPELRVSGPGHNSITWSPDGSEMFMVYHAHADFDKPGGRRTINIDRLRLDGEYLRIDGPTRSPQPMPTGAKLHRKPH
jgi:GH43 family beta-xylosidase